MEMMIKSFKEFECNIERINEEELILKDEKMNLNFPNEKIFINDNKELISLQMEEIQKDQKLFNMNSQAKADYFRGNYDQNLNNHNTKEERIFTNNYFQNLTEEEIDNLPSIIIDNGFGYIKAGFSGVEGPRAVFPSTVGYPKYVCGMVGGDKKRFFVGADAQAKSGVLKFYNPIDYAYDYVYWDNMEKIWEHVFTNELRVHPSQYNVMLTEPPMNPRENRQKMAEIMFEYFKVSSLYIAIQPVLSLYSAGKFTGIAVDSGERFTNFVPIYDGYSLPHAHYLMLI